MSDIGFMIGKVGELPVSKRTAPNRLDPMNEQIYKYFDLLKADETIKLPRKGIDKKKAYNKATCLRQALQKRYPKKIVGTSVSEEFIFIYSRGLRDEPRGVVQA